MIAERPVRNRCGKTILLVEDEAVIAMAEERALREYGYEVVTALSGEEAIVEKWFGWKPDDFKGPNSWVTVHPDDLDRIKAEFGRLLEVDRSTRTVEYRYRCKSGVYKKIRLTASNLVNDPVIDGILINYHEISERLPDGRASG